MTDYSATEEGLVKKVTRPPSEVETAEKALPGECPAMPGTRRCPPSICDCFIDLYPDDPMGLHPEAFTVGTMDVWDASVAPGGYVCGACGVPTESEPCREHQGPECACFWTPEETWLSAASCGYGGGYEPGSQREWNPDCPVHKPPLSSAREGQ